MDIAILYWVLAVMVVGAIEPVSAFPDQFNLGRRCSLGAVQVLVVSL